MLRGQGEAVVVAGGEQLLFPTPAVPVDRACGVDDEGGLQGEARCDDRLPGLDGGKRGAGAGQFLDACRLEDGTAHPAAHPQAGIGGVDDGVTLHGRDVVMDDMKRHGPIVPH